MKAVRARKKRLAPGSEEIAVAVEHHHRVVAAIEDEHAILRVDADSGDIAEREACGELAHAVSTA